MQAELDKLSVYSNELTDVTSEMSILRQELALSQEKANSTTYASIATEIEEHERELAKLTEVGGERERAGYVLAC
jgi:hypothetical protein